MVRPASIQSLESITCRSGPDQMVPSALDLSRCHQGINPQVPGASWLGFLPLVTWGFALMFAVLFGKSARRKLFIVLLKVSPVFIVWTALVTGVVVMVSNHGP